MHRETFLLPMSTTITIPYICNYPALEKGFRTYLAKNGSQHQLASTTYKVAKMPYNCEDFEPMEILLIIEPIKAADTYINIAEIWRRYLIRVIQYRKQQKLPPITTKLLVVGMAANYPFHPNYMDVMECNTVEQDGLWQSFDAFVAQAKPVTQLAPYPSNCQNMLPKLRLFFMGHDHQKSQSIIPLLSNLLRPVANIHFRLQEGDTFEQVYTKEIAHRLKATWQQVMQRWHTYRPFFACTPFRSALDRLQFRIGQLDAFLAVKQPTQKDFTANEVSFAVERIIKRLDTINKKYIIHTFKTILVIDDDPDFHTDINKNFSEKYTIENAYTPAQMYQKIAEQMQPFDLVLLDLNINTTNQLDGLRLIPSIKERLPEVTIIAVSSDNRQQVREQAEKAGCHYFLPKDSYDLMQWHEVFAKAIRQEGIPLQLLHQIQRMTSPAGSKGSILIVDDEKQWHHDLTYLFNNRYQLHHAYTIQQAKDKLAVSVDDYDLILLDLFFPEQDNKDTGLALLEDIGKNYPNLPVVVITGHPDQLTKAFTLGARHFLPKGYYNPVLWLKTFDLVIENKRLNNK